MASKDRGSRKFGVKIQAFGLLFAETVRYLRDRMATSADLQTQLSKMGQDIGRRLYEVVSFETQPAVRHVKLVPFLQWIQTTLWPAVFGKPATNLLKSTSLENSYMLYESEPVSNTYLAPKEGMNPAFFVAGIIEGACRAAELPANVTAHIETSQTVYLLQFEPAAAARGE